MRVADPKKCSLCLGTRVKRYTVQMRVGPRVVSTITYDAECPRCEARERIMNGGPKSPELRP